MKKKRKGKLIYNVYPKIKAYSNIKIIIQLKVNFIRINYDRREM